MQNNFILRKIDFMCTNADKRLSTYINVNKNDVKLEDIEILRNEFPYLEKSYLDFLSKYNGLRLSWCDFLSIKNSSMPSVYEYIEFLKEWEHHADYFPFAKDAAGAMYCFSKNKKGIWYFDVENFFDLPKYTSASFDEFINECVLGNRYSEFAYTENNPFYDFLKEQGWVSNDTKAD